MLSRYLLLLIFSTDYVNCSFFEQEDSNDIASFLGWGERGSNAKNTDGKGKCKVTKEPPSKKKKLKTKKPTGHIIIAVDETNHERENPLFEGFKPAAETGNSYPTNSYPTVPMFIEGTTIQYIPMMPMVTTMFSAPAYVYQRGQAFLPNCYPQFTFQQPMMFYPMQKGQMPPGMFHPNMMMANPYPFQQPMAYPGQLQQQAGEPYQTNEPYQPKELPPSQVSLEKKITKNDLNVPSQTNERASMTNVQVKSRVRSPPFVDREVVEMMKAMDRSLLSFPSRFEYKSFQTLQPHHPAAMDYFALIAA